MRRSALCPGFNILSISRALTLMIGLSLFMPGVGQANEAEEKGAVYELYRTEINVDGNQFTLTRHVRLTILNARGEDYADFHAWEGHWSKLKSVDIKVSRANGDIIYTRDKNDLTRICGFDGSSLYSDICHFVTELKSPTYPYIIEYTVVTEHKSLFELHNAPLQRSIPADTVEVLLEMKADDPIVWKVEGTDIEPSLESKGNKRRYLWQAIDQPGLDNVDFAPDWANEPAEIQFRANRFKLDNFSFEGSSWKEVGIFYVDLAADRYLPISNTPPVLDPETQRDSLKSIYESIIRSTRYVAIEIGIGGWQPYAAALTQSRAYGDCKDLTTLLVSRLRQAGIEAYPALLNTRGNGLTDPDFPSLSFNHVITAAVIDNDTIWLDPTCSACPLGETPYQDEALDLLLITDNGGLLTRTPSRPSFANLEKRSTTISIADNLKIDFTTRIEFTGQRAKQLRYRIPHLTRDDEKLYYRSLFPDSKHKFAIDSWEIENLEDFNQPLVLELSGHCLRPVDQIKAELYCKPMILDQLSSHETVSLKDRELPIKLYYPDRVEHQLTVIWDSSLSIGSIVPPADTSLTTPFSSVSFLATVDSTEVRIEFTKEYTEYELPTDQLEQFAQFQALLKDIAGKYVILNLDH